MFFVHAQQLVNPHLGMLAAAGLRWYCINVSSYCDANWRVVARSTGTTQSRVLDWLGRTE